MAGSLFERIGGRGAVDAAVDIFYERVLADERIAHFFEGVDMNRQRGKQKIFLAYAFGGPVKYDGKDLRAGHAHLDLQEKHFAAVAEHLQATLEELGVADELVKEVMGIAASTHDDVLGL
jgi:hemoglobin